MSLPRILVELTHLPLQQNPTTVHKIGIEAMSGNGSKINRDARTLTRIGYRVVPDLIAPKVYSLTVLHLHRCKVTDTRCRLDPQRVFTKHSNERNPKINFRGLVVVGEVVVVYSTHWNIGGVRDAKVWFLLVQHIVWADGEQRSDNSANKMFQLMLKTLSQ